MNVSRRCKQRPRIIPRNRGLRISLPCPNHNSVDPYMDPAVTISSVSFCEQCSQGPCWSSTLITAVGGRGHSITASHLNRRHMKRDEKESLKCFHSTCSYLHPYLPTISLKEWGVGGVGRNHRTPKTAAAYKECEGPQPREQAGKPYHIWQQRQNLNFINEQSGHESGLTCKG